MIRSFRHKGLKRLFETGKAQGINPAQAKRLLVRLDAMNRAESLDQLDLPGWKLHELKGNRVGTWSLHVTGNYRVTFEWNDGDCTVVDYEDYH